MYRLSLIFVLILCNGAKAFVDGDLRLSGLGSSASQGRVEIYKNGAWGTVCSRHFETEEAQVVCRQLGVPELYVNNSASVNDGRFGTGIGPIFIDDLKCHGFERRLLNCMFTPWNNNCGHDDDVGVICSVPPITTPAIQHPPPIMNTPTYTTGRIANGLVNDYGLCNNQNPQIRLVRSSSSMSGAGVVQVFVNGQWAGISDDCFNRAAAQVVCRTLCYDASKAVPGGDEFNRTGAQTPVVLTDVTCTGRENFVTMCAHTTSYTSTSELAMVTCVDMSTVTPSIRPPALNCDDGKITGNFSDSWEAFVPHSQITLVMPHSGVCNVRRDDHVSYITLSIPFDECGTMSSWNSTHIFYENSVLYVPAPTGIITRIRTYVVYLRCVLPRNYQTHKEVVPLTGSLEQTGTSNYTVLMHFYRDNFITRVTQYPLQVPVGDWLHVALEMVDIDKNVKLVVSSCYATPSSDRNHPTRYPLYTDKCKDDPTVSFFCLSDLQFGFRYQTFRFVQYNEVHIHCEAYVCPKADRSAECDCNCHRTSPAGKRKKRDTKRNWIHVKSSVILMVDPGEDRNNFDHMGPTTPSYPNSFTTQFQQSPHETSPTHSQKGTLVAVKVVKKKNMKYKKTMKSDTETDPENATADSAENQDNVPVQPVKGTSVDNDKESVPEVHEANKEVSVTKTDVGHDPVDVANPDENSNAKVTDEDVETLKDTTPEASNVQESAATKKPSAEHGPVAEHVVTPHFDKDIPTEADVKVINVVYGSKVDDPNAGIANLPEREVGGNATFERQVFGGNTAPGPSVPVVVFLCLIPIHFLVLLLF